VHLWKVTVRVFLSPALPAVWGVRRPFYLHRKGGLSAEWISMKKAFSHLRRKSDPITVLFINWM